MKSTTQATEYVEKKERVKSQWQWKLHFQPRQEGSDLHSYLKQAKNQTKYMEQ